MRTGNFLGVNFYEREKYPKKYDLTVIKKPSEYKNIRSIKIYINKYNSLSIKCSFYNLFLEWQDTKMIGQNKNIDFIFLKTKEKSY